MYNTVYYKEYPLVTGDMDETVIITYSPKYKAYQQRIRAGQIERAIKIMQSPDKARKGKNPNDPSRFIQKTAVTGDGEIAQKQIFQLDEERIREEAMYDGFYAVVTNLEGDVREIININKRHWEIEENFRIMKTEFEARPVYVRREDSIKAHFLTCYISLLVYRLLEKKLLEEFTCSEILKTLREMNMTLLSKDSGYIPSYKRTKLTDALHTAFGFRTDYEFISMQSLSFFHHIKPVIYRSYLIFLRIEQIYLSRSYNIHYTFSACLVLCNNLCRSIFVVVAFLIGK